MELSLTPSDNSPRFSPSSSCKPFFTSSRRFSRRSAYSRNITPASVSRTGRAPRTNSGCPSESSSLRIDKLTAGCVRYSRSAAREKLPSFATVTKTVSSLRSIHQPLSWRPLPAGSEVAPSSRHGFPAAVCPTGSISWNYKLLYQDKLDYRPLPVRYYRGKSPGALMSHVRIFDTTLRDGEQSPGFSMNTSEKIRMAQQLSALGVDIIEAGFPIASRGDLEAVRAVAKEVRHVPIAALARARKEDVAAAVEALEHAAHSRLHIFLATSDLHLQVKLNMTREKCLEAIGAMVKEGRKHVGEVEFSAEDAGRTDIDFLCEVCSVAVKAGATILNLPDTVGYAVPEEYGAMFTRIREHLGDPKGVTLSAHCHDDLGMAVANSLAAVRAGVRQIEC